MKIERVRHVDSSEPDDAGMYDYHYEYDIYRFTKGENSFVARSYTDDPGEAHFLRAEHKGIQRGLVDVDLTRPLFLAALAHLRQEGKATLRWLSGRGDGYESVP